MSNTCNYHYKVMPFGLKNAGATYQRLMDRVFAQKIGRNLEVYIDDMVVKTTMEGSHHEDLEDILASVRKYNMRLNPAKCSFGVQAGKFLGFMLTNRGIEANPEKCQAIIDMRSPTSVKEVQQLTGRITALSRFLSCAG
ncbi:gag-pol polyprotein, partial [Trifolium medium]|nr:gag-pol polyprotein [Trifolium medium]